MENKERDKISKATQELILGHSKVLNKDEFLITRDDIKLVSDIIAFVRLDFPISPPQGDYNRLLGEIKDFVEKIILLMDAGRYKDACEKKWQEILSNLETVVPDKVGVEYGLDVTSVSPGGPHYIKYEEDDKLYRERLVGEPKIIPNPDKVEAIEFADWLKQNYIPLIGGW